MQLATLAGMPFLMVPSKIWASLDASLLASAKLMMSCQNVAGGSAAGNSGRHSLAHSPHQILGVPVYDSVAWLHADVLVLCGAGLCQTCPVGIAEAVGAADSSTTAVCRTCHRRMAVRAVRKLPSCS